MSLIVCGLSNQGRMIWKIGSIQNQEVIITLYIDHTPPPLEINNQSYHLFICLLASRGMCNYAQQVQPDSMIMNRFQVLELVGQVLGSISKL